MDEKKQIRACAKLDGREVYDSLWKQGGQWWTAIEGNVGRIHVFAYDTHDDMQRLIDGLSFEGENCELVEYDLILDSMFTWFGFHKATPAQKREALLKAKGLWED